MIFDHRFTECTPDIEKAIHRDMAFAVDVIREKISNVIAIYISGIFGKGAGAIVFYNNKRFINDYDFVVIIDSSQKKQRNKVAKILMDEFQFYVSVACVYPDLSNLNYNTQNDMDLVFNSKCLYGQDIISEQHIEKYSIRKEDALKLLHSRVRTIFDCFNSVDQKLIINNIDFLVCVKKLCFDIKTCDPLSVSLSAKINLFSKQVLTMLLHSINKLTEKIQHNTDTKQFNMSNYISKMKEIIFHTKYFIGQRKFCREQLSNYNKLVLTTNEFQKSESYLKRIHFLYSNFQMSY